MMTPHTCLTAIIEPTLDFLGPPYDTHEAACMLLAIALQESGLTTRVQTGGPARGYWQFERSTATNDFVVSGNTYFKDIVQALGFQMNPYSLWEAISLGADQLACVLARERLYRMVKEPLPKIGDEEASWEQYLKAWGPNPRTHTVGRQRWGVIYPQAVETGAWPTMGGGKT